MERIQFACEWMTKDQTQAKLNFLRASWDRGWENTAQGIENLLAAIKAQAPSWAKEIE